MESLSRDSSTKVLIRCGHLYAPVVMSCACLARLTRCSGLVQKALVPQLFQHENFPELTHFHRKLFGPSRRQYSSSRFDPDSSGRPTTWDSFGIWDDRIDEPILLPPSIRYGKIIPNVNLMKVGCASLIGQRKENEDRFQVSQMTENIHYFAVFDGHGGPEAADFCEKYMEKFIKSFLAEDDNLEMVLTKAFLEIDKAFAKHLHFFPNGPGINSGTTATVALLRDGIELVVASVGDSRAMLCRKGKAVKLTVDHTPERKDEKERVKRSGGFITWNSLGQPNVNGRLAMTRSIGDLDLKKTGVIAEPETKRESWRSAVLSANATTPKKQLREYLTRLYIMVQRTTVQSSWYLLERGENTGVLRHISLSAEALCPAVAGHNQNQEL
ncbi:hypothetical protein OJAV_G00005550 [Oryzias javanicus]|uniref:PPM-type phosphatase domain-containing protein n=1 Tax=Oryzias javanicus TaxID=123683 RepID=A0A3S2Q1L5_ORYJA|nr:hypothetical protein OJAV_G00005550 [Oryzias javanicus]